MTDIRIGCCGFCLPQGEYWRRFRLIEVQHTFYQPPMLSTLARWRAAAPPEFEFTLKAWQLITHEPRSPTYRRLRRPIPAEARERYGSFRQSEEVWDAWRVTLDCARALRATAIVFQCPASFTPSDEHVDNLRRFFRRIRRQAGKIRLAWEPRGGWPRELVDALCAELGLAWVPVDPLREAPPAGPWRYFRLHGGPGVQYDHTYSPAELRGLLALRGETTYYLFNNSAMLEDAGRFEKLAAGVASA